MYLTWIERKLIARFQNRIGPVELDEQVQLRRLAGGKSAPQAADLHEHEALGKDEILLEQPIALERAPGLRQQRVVVVEDGTGRDDDIAIERGVAAAAAVRVRTADGRYHTDRMRVATAR